MGILLLGKAFSTAVIALLMVTVTFGFGAIAFGVRIEGSVIGFFVLAAAASGLASTMGLLVASLGGTEARARSICILAILGISMLGGLWIPSFILPGWARDIALSLPTTWAMRGLDQVTWQTGSFWSILPSLSALIAFMALFLSIAVAKILTSEARRRRGIL
jgi:ABC-2 type transport system permease protein